MYDDIGAPPSSVGGDQVTESDVAEMAVTSVIVGADGGTIMDQQHIIALITYKELLM